MLKTTIIQGTIPFRRHLYSDDNRSGRFVYRRMKTDEKLTVFCA